MITSEGEDIARRLDHFAHEYRSMEIARNPATAAATNAAANTASRTSLFAEKLGIGGKLGLKDITQRAVAMYGIGSGGKSILKASLERGGLAKQLSGKSARFADVIRDAQAKAKAGAS